MPIKELPSDTPLDSPTSKVTELPSGTQLDPATPDGSKKPLKSSDISQPSWWGALGKSLAHGATDLFYGGAQTGAHMGPEEGGAAFVDPADLAARQATVDKAVKERQTAYEQDPSVKAYPKTAWTGNVAGEVATIAPLFAVPGAAPTLPARMIGAGLTAIPIGAARPVSDTSKGDYATQKAKQVAGEVAAAGIGQAVGEKVIAPAVKAVGEGIGKAAGRVFGFGEDFLAQYNRAVKPTVVGKRTASQRAGYEDDVKGAVSSIIDNKANLTFTDEQGHVTTGELPKSLAQFSEAIGQTKQKIFDAYDALAQGADAQGTKISLLPATLKLNEIARDPVMRDLNPSVAQYASDMVNRLLVRGEYSPGEMQRAIRTLNEGLDAFYKNPSRETASHAMVDARFAAVLRENLDNAITRLSGPGYQALKNQYGALKAIERDVNNRVGVVARQEKGGGILGRIASVGAIGDVLHGILTLKLGPVAEGLALKAVAERIRLARNPDNVTAGMFKQAEAQRARPTSAGPAQPDWPGMRFVWPSLGTALVNSMPSAPPPAGDISPLIVPGVTQIFGPQ